MPCLVKVPEFLKDLKKFKVDIQQDLELFEKALKANPTNLNGAVKISNLGEGVYPVYKARKFRCKALKKGSQSGIRVVYTYNPSTGDILLIEIYQKNRQENHNADRIRSYLIKF